MDLVRRLEADELMDTESLSLPVMLKTLQFLELTNTYFGGRAVVLRHFNDWARRWRPGEKIRVLDVGTGLADLPRALVKWGRRRNFEFEIRALDMVPEIADLAREACSDYPEITVQCGDVRNLGAETFDYVLASLFLHHIPPLENAKTLKLFDSLSGRGFLVSDLHRSPTGYAGVWLLSHLLGNRIVRHDGPVSVRRAFTIRELQDLASEAGLPYLKARLEPFFRLSLSGEKV